MVEQTLRALRNVRVKISSTGLRSNRAILHIARIPMVGLSFDPEVPFPVKIGLHNRLSILNSFIVRAYVQADSRVAIHIGTVKHLFYSSTWNEKHSFTDSHSGVLNSYAISLLVIHYLQIHHVVPNLQKMLPHIQLTIHPRDLFNINFRTLRAHNCTKPHNFSNSYSNTTPHFTSASTASLLLLKVFRSPRWFPSKHTKCQRIGSPSWIPTNFLQPLLF